MHLWSIFGSRPQYMKAFTLDRAVRDPHTHLLIDTGQHYDAGMAQAFPREGHTGGEADVNLGIGSGPQSIQTATMMTAIWNFVDDATRRGVGPDAILTYGDTTSTLAASLVARKERIPLVHIEAGLRSRDMGMAEEVNRMTADICADICMTPTRTATENLAQEHIPGTVVEIGDLLYECFLQEYRKALLSPFPHTIGGSSPRRGFPPVPGFSPDRGYILLTLHRAETVDVRARLACILAATEVLPLPVLFPCHPRTHKMLRTFGLSLPENVYAIPPIRYRDMLAAILRSSHVMTDSGGVQREAFFAGKMTTILRPTTEWPETLAHGMGRLAWRDSAEIRASVTHRLHGGRALCGHEDHPCPWQEGDTYPFGDGRAGERAVAFLAECFA